MVKGIIKWNEFFFNKIERINRIDIVRMVEGFLLGRRYVLSIRYLYI